MEQGYELWLTLGAAPKTLETELIQDGFSRTDQPRDVYIYAHH